MNVMEIRCMEKMAEDETLHRQITILKNPKIVNVR